MKKILSVILLLITITLIVSCTKTKEEKMLEATIFACNQIKEIIDYKNNNNDLTILQNSELMIIIEEHTRRIKEYYNKGVDYDCKYIQYNNTILNTDYNINFNTNELDCIVESSDEDINIHYKKSSKCMNNNTSDDFKKKVSCVHSVNKNYKIFLEYNIKNGSLSKDDYDGGLKLYYDLYYSCLEKANNKNDINKSNLIYTDPAKGLMWQITPNTNLNRNDAYKYALNSTLAGFTDWRLPSKEEIKLLYNCSSYKCSPIKQIDNKVISYWTNSDRSVSFYGSPGKVYFKSDEGIFPGMELGTKSGVRLVRDIK